MLSWNNEAEAMSLAGLASAAGEADARCAHTKVEQ
jgi:hypothetical protein